MADETRTQAPSPKPTEPFDYAEPLDEAEVGTATGVGTNAPVTDTKQTFVQSPDDAVRAAAESAASPRLSIPDYEILGELGRGAMGVVYKARHTKLNRIDALKMAIGGRVDEKNLIRFLAEAEDLASVKHENVVQVYSYGEVDGRPWMALEFCPGGPLSKRVADEPNPDPADAAAMLCQIAAGVAAAHAAGIVHRDLKPGNVLLTELGKPKVADFGLAKRAASDLTATQAVMGTPAYMSPEQAGGKTKFVGPQADVWALGVILYEWLSSQRPFGGDSNDEILAKVLNVEPPALRAVAPGVPRELELICRKCLEKVPADRYPSARELADDLERYLRGEPISVHPLGPGARLQKWARRNPFIAGLMGLVLLATVGLIVSLVFLYSQAVAKANAEADAKTNAENTLQQERLRKEEELRRVEAESKAREEARHAVFFEEQAANLAELLDRLFRSSDPLSVFFSDAPADLAPGGSTGQAAALGPFLRNAADQFREKLTDKSPRVRLLRARLLSSIGNGMKSLGMYADAKDVLGEALAIRKEYLKESDPDVWRSELALGRLEIDYGDAQTAAARFRDLLQAQERAGAPEEAVLTTKLHLGAALVTLGMVEAEPLLRGLIKDRERVNGKNHKDTLLAKFALITWFVERQNWKGALPLFTDFHAGIKTIPDPRVRAALEPIVDCQIKLAAANVRSVFPVNLGDLIKGIKGDIAKLGAVLPEDHVYLTIMRFELAKLLVENGDTQEGDALYARVLDDVRRTVGVAHPKALVLLDFYTVRLVRRNRMDEARQLYREFEEAIAARFGPVSPWLTALHLRRAVLEVEFKGGNADFATTAAYKAVELIQRGMFLPSFVNLIHLMDAATVLNNSGHAGHREAAREMLAALRPLVAKVHGEASNEMLVVLVAEGRQSLNAGNDAAALATFTTARDLLPRVADAELQNRIDVNYWRGQMALKQGQFAEAEARFQEAWKLVKDERGVGTGDRAEYAASLGVALACRGKFAEAIPHLKESQRLTPKSRDNERQFAWMDMLVATAQHGAGERDNYRKSLEKMVKQYGASKNLDTLVRLAWAGGISPEPAGWNPGEFVTALGGRSVNYPWGNRGFALALLRAGRLADADVVLRGALPEQPSTDAMRGLIALARNDIAAAREHLATAELLLAAESSARPDKFPYAHRPFFEAAQTVLLIAELKAELAARVAPPPREKSK